MYVELFYAIVLVLNTKALNLILKHNKACGKGRKYYCGFLNREGSIVTFITAVSQ